MKQTLKQALQTSWPYVVVILAIVVGIQAWCIARMSRHLAQQQAPISGGFLSHPFDPNGSQPPGQSLWSDDAWKDPFFNDPFDANIWDPFQEMQSMRDRMNGMFGEAFGRFSQSPRFNDLFESSGFTPNIDVEDKGDHYLVTIDLPGSDHNNVDISCQNQQLTISGQLNHIREDRQGSHLLRQERRSGRFSRTIPLPEPVNVDKMKTDFDKGIVRITIPKADSG